MDCLACTAPADPVGGPIIHRHVEVRTQYASPDLIAAIAYQDYDRRLDPNWRSSGAKDPDEYAFWSSRCCGMACLQMILEHRDGSAPDLLPLLRGARQQGAYVVEDDGSVTGMIYAPFVAYIGAEFGLTGRVHPRLPLKVLLGELAPVQSDEPVGQWTGRLVIASVHKEIRRPERPSPGRGGHLVLVTGHDPTAGTVSFRNPSGHTPAARTATLPVDQFETFYAGRGVSVLLTR